MTHQEQAHKTMRRYEWVTLIIGSAAIIAVAFVSEGDPWLYYFRVPLILIVVLNVLFARGRC
jgi:hypothetical protein